MNTIGAIVRLGVGGTVAILVAAIVTTLLEPTIEFSVFVGIPVGVFAGVVAVVLVSILLERTPTPLVRSICTGIAAFGYALVGLYAIRVFVPRTRQTFGFPELPLFALGIGIIVLGGSYWVYQDHS